MTLINFEYLYTLSRRSKLIWFISGLTGFVIANLLFPNDVLNATGSTIIDFEFAWNAERMDEILINWAGILPTTIRFMWIDMAYPLFYFTLISGLTISISPVNELGEKLFKFSFYSILIAMICDYIENIFSFLVLYNPDTYAAFYVPMISLFASVKFFLLLVSLILSLIHIFLKISQKPGID